MEAPSSLHFHGPFTFVDHGRGIATCKFAESEGIYLWILKDGSSRYIHYVGQTSGFRSRHEDHLFRILGLQYALFRTDAVTANDPNWLFGGMWRLWKTNPGEDALTITVTRWKELQQDITPYLENIEVFFAPTLGLSDVERRHVEGCIAHSLRTKHPNDARFYPSDNRTGRAQPWNVTVPLTSDRPIMGLDTTLEL